jgi:hypothetical protein
MKESKGDEKLKKGIFLLAIFLTLVLSMTFAKNSVLFVLEVKVVPEYPCSDDVVNVTLSFSFSTNPPNIQNFGELTQSDHNFSVVTTIYVPAMDEPTLPMQHTEGHTYNLGKLSPGSYYFHVYIQTIHGSYDYWLQTTVNITVYFLTDINKDGKVNIQDLYIAAKAFGTEPGDERWSEIADINKDGKVDIKDIYRVAKDFGKSL